MTKRYTLPVSDSRGFRDVTEQRFDISVYPEAFVDFSELRDGFDLFDKIFIDLNFVLENDKYVYVPSEFGENYPKFIFSGHMGCGKSAELYRLYDKMRTEFPHAYHTVFVPFETLVDPVEFEEKDFLPLLIFSLAESLEGRAGFDMTAVNTLLSDIYGITKDKFNNDAQINLGFLTWTFKDLHFGSKQKNTARENLTNNATSYTGRFNIILDDLRKTLGNRDIFFIVDGTEKVNLGVYKKLFADGRQKMTMLRLKMLLTVPIDTYFNMETMQAFQGFYEELGVMPMPNIGRYAENAPNHANPVYTCFRKVLEKRANFEQFIDEESLDFIIKNSGGSIRQFLNLVNESFKEAKGKKIYIEAAERVAMEYGRRIYERLHRKHLEIIRDKKYDAGGEDVAVLFYGLAVIKYNGIREINPLLIMYLEKYYPEFLPN